MTTVSFGDARFSITARDLVVFEPSPALSQLQIIVAGEGWSLHAPGVDETLGVVAERLGHFVSTSAARHWGSFVGLGSPEEVVERVSEQGFGMPNPSSSDYHRWDVSSAFVNYSLSSCFDNNLGVQQAVVVRSDSEETLIWQTVDGDVEVAVVSAVNFDEVLAAFIQWANQDAKGLQEDGSLR